MAVSNVSPDLAGLATTNFRTERSIRALESPPGGERHEDLYLLQPDGSSEIWSLVFLDRNCRSCLARRPCRLDATDDSLAVEVEVCRS